MHCMSNFIVICYCWKNSKKDYKKIHDWEIRCCYQCDFKNSFFLCFKVDLVFLFWFFYFLFFFLELPCNAGFKENFSAKTNFKQSGHKYSKNEIKTHLHLNKSLKKLKLMKILFEKKLNKKIKVRLVANW